MKVLTKPKQYQLPQKITKRNSSSRLFQSPSKSLSHSLIKSNSKSPQKSQAHHSKPSVQIGKLPNIFMQRRIKSSMSTYKDITVSYVKSNKPNNVETQNCRKQIRKALGSKINFVYPSNAALQNNCYKFIPSQLINKLQQKVKPLQYDSQQYQHLYDNIKDILGTDIQLQYKDIIAAYGIVTQSYYIFFTAAYSIPYSLCCKSVIYICVEERARNVEDRYVKKDIMAKYLGKVVGGRRNQDYIVVNKFICSKCFQVVLVIQCKSPEYQQQSRVTLAKKKDDELEAQRYKISMSIVVASGRFKRMRIDQAMSRKDSIEVMKPRYERKNLTQDKSISSIKKITSKYLLF